MVRRNADGARKTGITIPSAPGQAELMRDVLSRSGLAAGDVDFIEVSLPWDDAPIEGLYAAGNSVARMETGAV